MGYKCKNNFFQEIMYEKIVFVSLRNVKREITDNG
jgi:hypothetical protein